MKIIFKVEYTARKTPQQNSVLETGFTMLAAQSGSMMNVAQIPEVMRFKLWSKTVMTATSLNNLVVETVDGITRTRWEHAGFK